MCRAPCSPAADLAGDVNATNPQGLPDSMVIVCIGTPAFRLDWVRSPWYNNNFTGFVTLRWSPGLSLRAGRWKEGGWMLGGSVWSGAAWRFCLWLILAVSALPAGAQYGGGIGTAESPFLVFSAEQLNAIGANPDHWSRHFRLMADIDLGAYGPADFHIIGTSDEGPFAGVFDGNHKTISNFRHRVDFGGSLGFFGMIEGVEARVENLTLVDPNVASETGRYIGAMAGSLSGGTMSNCHVRGGDVLGLSFVGGLVGRNDGGTIAYCTVSATVRGTSRVGGLLGQSYYGIIERCQTTGAVLGDSSSYWVGGLIGESRNAAVRDCRASCTVQGELNVGGLAGENLTGTVDRCCAAGVVRGGTYVGGLLGLNSGGIISDCYATADVKGTIYVGGLAGCNGPSCHCIVYEPGMIVRCYAVGPSWGVNSGGLVGMNDKSQTRASFWDVETTGRAESAGGDGRSTSEMGMLSTYFVAGWDFVAEKTNGTQGIWYLPAGGSYPRLAWELAAGDFDADGRVDFRDYSRLAAQWRQAGAAGLVDFEDLMDFANLWLAGRRENR